MKGTYEEIGRRIRAAREQRGWSQERLGEVLGVTQTAVNYYENGRRRIDVAGLQRVAEVLGRPLTYFTGERAWDPAAAVRAVVRERLADVLDIAFVPLVSPSWDGRPLTAGEDADLWLTLPRPLARHASLAFRVRDAALASRGILQNDIVFIRPRPVGEAGHVVLARVDGGLVLREFAVEAGRAVLRGDAAADVPAGDGVEVIGVVAGLYRQL